MIANIEHKGKHFKVDLSDPIDISIPLRAGKENVNAFHLSPMKIEPFRIGDFVGSVESGGPCNVNNIFFNPHGNGTHTESVGHISSKSFPINDCLKQFFFKAQLISVTPEKVGSDLIITKHQLMEHVKKNNVEALIIRTLPNDTSKLVQQYSGTNPAYLDVDAAQYLVDCAVQHLLLDLPSVDKEEDGGELNSHHTFWNYPGKPRKDCTITEMIFVPKVVPDGFYLLNIQIASFVNDASPSKPILYKIF